MQFTTDEDEEFEEVVGEMESVAATLGQGEALARSSQPVNYAPGTYYILIGAFVRKKNSLKLFDKLFWEFCLGGHNEEDSKQAAEAMVQLSGVGFYHQQGKLNFWIYEFMRNIRKKFMSENVKINIET